jgi:hypothetical protein
LFFFVVSIVKRYGKFHYHFLVECVLCNRIFFVLSLLLYLVNFATVPKFQVSNNICRCPWLALAVSPVLLMFCELQLLVYHGIYSMGDDFSSIQTHGRLEMSLEAGTLE